MQNRPTFCLAALSLATAGLGGCVLGPDFSPPRPPEEAHYRAAPPPVDSASPAPPRQQVEEDRTVTGNWWDLFQSPALNGIVRDAVAGNRNLAQMQATLAQTEELALAATGSRYPQVTLAGGVGRQKYGAEFLGGLINLPPFTYFAVGPAVSYTLDYDGAVRRGIEREGALVDSAREQVAAAYLAVTGQAVLQAIAMASAREQISVVEVLLAQDRDNLKLVTAAFDAGSVARIDVLSAESQLQADLTLLPPLHQELSLARHALSLLLGRAPAAAAVHDVELSELKLPGSLPVGLPSALARRRPDILQAEAELHAATSAVGIAEANLYPKITLTASLAQEAQRPGRLVDGSATAWSLISGFTAPLFDGGSLRAQKRASVDALRASAARYEQTVLTAFSQVADLLDALDHDAEQLEAQSNAEQTARSELDLARASYALGHAGILQVLDAQRAHLQAQLGFVKASAQRYADTAQLSLALGGSSPME